MNLADHCLAGVVCSSNLQIESVGGTCRPEEAPLVLVLVMFMMTLCTANMHQQESF